MQHKRSAEESPFLIIGHWKFDKVYCKNRPLIPCHRLAKQDMITSLLEMRPEAIKDMGSYELNSVEGNAAGTVFCHIFEVRTEQFAKVSSSILLKTKQTTSDTS